MEDGVKMQKGENGMNSEKDKQEEFPGNLSKTIKFALKLKDNKAVRNMEELREYFDINEIMESFLDGKLIEWLSDRSYVDRKAATNGELSRSEKVKNLKIEFDKVKKAAKETGYEGQLEAKARDVAKKLCDILEKKRDEAVDQSIKDLNISTVENLMNKEDYLLNYLSEVFVKKNIDKLAHNQQELNRLIKNGVKNISLFVPMSDNAETYIIMKHAMKKGRRFIGVGNKKANIRIVGEDGSYMDDEQIENLLSENKITLDNIIYKIDDNKESVEDEVNQSRNAELQQGVSAYDESSRKKVHDKLIRYMDACFPLIYLTTFEEEKVDDIIKQLNTYGIKPIVVDPWASERDAMHEYGVTLTPIEEVADADCIIVAVAHNEFRALSLDDIKKMFKDGDDSEKVLIDVKGLYKIEELKASGMQWWRL